MKFSELNLEESVLQALEAMRFEECTCLLYTSDAADE